MALVAKNSPANAGDARDEDSGRLIHNYYQLNADRREKAAGDS